MKKMLSMTLAAMMSVSLVLPSVGSASGNHDVVSGTSYTKLPATEFGGATVASELELSNLVVNKSQLVLHGKVNSGEASTPFHIIGDLKESEKFAKGVTGKFTDKLGNYDVVHFSVAEIGEGETAALLHDKTAGTKLRLYLMKKDTREFSVFEGNIDQIKGHKGTIEQVLADEASFDQAEEFGTDFWQPLVFKPIDGGQRVEDIEINTETGEETVVSKEESGEVGAYGRGTSYIDRSTREFTYYETYTASASCTMTYYIKGRVRTSVSVGTGGGVIWITNKYTTSNCSLYQSDDSPFGVGYPGNPVKIVTITSGYDEFIDFTMGHQNALDTSSWWSGPKISLGVGLSYYGLSAGLSWEFDLSKIGELSSDFPYSTAPLANPSTNNYPTKIGGQWTDYLLPVENAQFYLTGNIKDKSSSGTTSVDSSFDFTIGANYGTGWDSAAIPADYDFYITSYDYR